MQDGTGAAWHWRMINGMPQAYYYLPAPRIGSVFGYTMPYAWNQMLHQQFLHPGGGLPGVYNYNFGGPPVTQQQLLPWNSIPYHLPLYYPPNSCHAAYNTFAAGSGMMQHRPSWFFDPCAGQNLHLPAFVGSATSQYVQPHLSTLPAAGNQAVLVEELTKQVRSSPDWEHSWDSVGDRGCVLPFGKDLGTVLLGNWQQVEEVRYPDNNRGQGKSRGLALIVSIESGRRGAAVDRGKLATLFLTCGFKDVHHHVDLKASELKHTIKCVAASGILEEGEAFICSINGHGGTDYDGQPYIVDENNEKVMVMRDIIEPFRRSKHLLNKPKVFFINCCRGTKIYVNSGVDEAGHVSHAAAQDAHDDQQGTGSVRPHLQELSDSLLVFSTCEGCPSCRNPKTGTIFVEKLVETVTEKRQTTDVLSMMTMVNDGVNEVQNPRVVDGTNVKVGQCCEVRSFLRKKLYWKGA